MAIKTITTIFFLFFALLEQAQGQNLFDQQIRKIPTEKRSVFFDSGIFHNGNPKIQSSLKGIRTSYSNDLNRERLVFDFTTETIPRVYAFLAPENNRLFLHFFNSQLTFDPVFSGVHMQRANIFLFQPDEIPLELLFKDKVSIDIFQLAYPGRLVIDIKN